MRFGFASITCERYPGDRRSNVELYGEALALAEEAERLGFDSIWTCEHHFLDDSFLPSPLPVCAAIAARTSRITIGTDVALAPLYEPVRLAEDAAVIDLLSGGRLVLGLAQGWRPEEFEGLRIPLRGRHRRFEDTVKVLRQAWSDGLVRGGEEIAYPGISVTPKPAQLGGPPIWLGGATEPAVRRAARIADGFMAAWTPVEAFAEKVHWVRQELAEAGRASDAFTISLVVPTFAYENEATWKRVREHCHYYVWKHTEDMLEARARTGRPAVPPPLTAEGEASLRASGLLLGTPEQIAEDLQHFDEIAGGDLHFLAEFCWPGMSPELLREAMKIFADGVIAQLR